MNEDNFYSVNRLIEFGMSMAVAQQMIQTMNSALSNMQFSTTQNSIQSTTQQFYYAIINGCQAGPFSEQEISRLIAEKKIVKETYVWKPSMLNWEIAEKVPEVLKLVALTPPPFNSNKQ